MKILDRLILALYSLCIGIVSLVIMIIPFDITGLINVKQSVGLVESMKGNYFYTLISLMFLVISLRFLLSGIMGTKDVEKGSYLVIKNEYGEIIIYSQTIVGLVQNVANSFSGISNINTEVELINDQIQIMMEGQVFPEINIPDISRELQVKVKEHLENTTGANVGEVKVEINDVSTPTRIVK